MISEIAEILQITNAKNFHLQPGSHNRRGRHFLLEVYSACEYVMADYGVNVILFAIFGYFVYFFRDHTHIKKCVRYRPM